MENSKKKSTSKVDYLKVINSKTIKMSQAVIVDLGVQQGDSMFIKSNGFL